MVGLGVRDDEPPIDLQPRLIDAIHLRWAFARDRGFPWFGYYLFRRPHENRGRRCLAAELPQERDPAPSTNMATRLGVLDSDTPLTFTDTFAPAGRSEIDLRDRTLLRLDLPPSEPAYRVRVELGLHETGIEQVCIDFGALRPGLIANPLKLQDTVLEVQDMRGERLPRLRIINHISDGRAPGAGPALDVAGRLVATLPSPITAVEVELTAGARSPVVAAVADDGRVLARTVPDLDERTPRTVTLAAETAFRTLRVEAAQGLVLLHRLCWRPRQGRIEIPVTAFDGPVTVAREVIAGQGGQILDATLTHDRITAVEIGGGPAALVELCAEIVPDVAQKEWAPVPNCPRPILLPFTHPDYPLRASPPDEAAAETEALDRITYGPLDPWRGDNFAELHEQLTALVVGGPPGPASRAMAAPERAQQNLAGVPDPPSPGVESPSIPALHPLDLVLLGSLHPAVAQMIGLYWADTEVNPQASFDYLIVADHQGIARGRWQDMLAHIERRGFDDVDAWIVFDRRMAKAPPLDPPAGVRVYALPGGTYREPGGVEAGVAEAEGNAGIAWQDGLDPAGHLRPGQTVFHHVWRDRQGNAANPAPSAEAEQLVTDTGPVLVSHPVGIVTEAPQAPGDWPRFGLSCLDFGLAEGWYGYQVNGIDLFGRFSPRSPFAPWRQWAPEPQPRPWYYRDPPGDQVIHPSSVRILDRTPPPTPASLEAWALDPADPMVIQDAAYLAWRDSLPAAQHDTLVGLRVRWRWTAAQQRQAPDTAEFRLYWHAGTHLPGNWQHVPSWTLRGHVTAFADAAAVAGNSDRTYEVFLPPAPGQGPFGGGLPLNPTRAEPVAYGHVTVTAVDDAAHAPDTWPGAGPLAGRSGNESACASAARVFRVLREPPPPPEAVVDSERVYATPADWHARSFHTFRWVPQPDVGTHVCRAMDETVFAADWAHQPRDPLDPGDAEYFPDPAAEPTWNAAKRQQVCDDLNALRGLKQGGASREEALQTYRALSDDALRVLAGLPGCDKAFTQLTFRPLDVGDPEIQDRRGPDDPPGYVPRAGVRAYLDTLDGRALNRYLYRAATVDSAQNRSGLGPVGTPVRLPNVVPPRAPAITRVTAGDRGITLAWASNREPDLLEYRVFRADDAVGARDVRGMTQMAVVAADPDPAARPGEVTWTDEPVPGLRDFWYRVVAVDRPDPVDPRGGGGNLSEPSPPKQGRARQPRPDPPVLQPPAWDAAHTTVDLAWDLTDPFLTPRVERRDGEGDPWTAVGDWLPAGTTAAADVPPDPAGTFEYRVRVRDHIRQQAVSDPTATP
jgi:hypothetical protein